MLGKLGLSQPTERPSPLKAPSLESSLERRANSPALLPFPAHPTASTFDGTTIYSGSVASLLPSSALPPLAGITAGKGLFLVFRVDIGTSSGSEAGTAILLQDYTRNNDGDWDIGVEQTIYMPWLSSRGWEVFRAGFGDVLAERVHSFLPFAYVPPEVTLGSVESLASTAVPSRAGMLNKEEMMVEKADWVERGLRAIENFRYTLWFGFRGPSSVQA
ncbi:MAG: hypothetical protein M1829_003133 [Trizodia sp. TS-e1964]|nr:MAG: hypothetical protein M1829_003133 [Trizodia sp. TS-e1964]